MHLGMLPSKILLVKRWSRSKQFQIGLEFYLVLCACVINYYSVCISCTYSFSGRIWEKGPNWTKQFVSTLQYSRYIILPLKSIDDITVKSGQLEQPCDPKLCKKKVVFIQQLVNYFNDHKNVRGSHAAARVMLDTRRVLSQVDFAAASQMSVACPRANNSTGQWKPQQCAGLHTTWKWCISRVSWL